MEFFEVKTDEVEERTKQKFMESYQKQMKLCRILLTSIFGVLGGMFLILGVPFLFSNTDAESMIVCMSVGGMFLGFAILFFLIFTLIKPDKAYERMKKIQNKYGVMNLYTMSSTIQIQSERITELEARLEEVEAEQEILRRRLNK